MRISKCDYCLSELGTRYLTFIEHNAALKNPDTVIDFCDWVCFGTWLADQPVARNLAEQAALERREELRQERGL